jgi:hypothetical protein
MELSVNRTSERKVRVLETSFQNLQWNYEYIGIPKATVRVLETAFQKLLWSYIYIELANGK